MLETKLLLLSKCNRSKLISSKRISVPSNFRSELEKAKNFRQRDIDVHCSFLVHFAIYADDNHDILPTTITNHLSNKVKQKNVTFWTDLVDKKFGDIIQQWRDGDRSRLEKPRKPDEDEPSSSHQGEGPSAGSLLLYRR